MRTIHIEWQRLLDDRHETCPRCRSTEREIEKAVRLLEKELSPLGIHVTLQKTAIGAEVFKKDALRSNTIRIEGRTLEEWLGARTGRSRCCKTCGDAECRTVEIAGQIHETIPSDLIAQAAREAAASRYPVRLQRANRTQAATGGRSRVRGR